MYGNKFSDYEIKVGYYIYWISEELGNAISIVTDIGENTITTKDIHGENLGYIETFHLDTEWIAYKIRVFKTKEELLRCVTPELL